MKKKVFVVVVGCSITVVVLELVVEMVHCVGSCVAMVVVTIVDVAMVGSSFSSFSGKLLCS